MAGIVQRARASHTLKRTITALDAGAQPVLALLGSPSSEFNLLAAVTGWTAWTLLLEGSLDGVLWETLATHNAGVGSGKTVPFSGWATGKFWSYARVSLTVASGGTTGQQIAATLLAVQ